MRILKKRLNEKWDMGKHILVRICEMSKNKNGRKKK